MELTTKAEPILGKFKDLGGFCGSSFWRSVKTNYDHKVRGAR